jgi:hypothetical protein
MKYVQPAPLLSCATFAFQKWKMQNLAIKEGPLTKNGPVDFAQSWAIYMRKSNYIYGEEKNGGHQAFFGP